MACFFVIINIFFKTLPLHATTTYKIYWDNHFLQRFQRDHAADKLLTHNIDIGEGKGGLNGGNFKFFKRKP